MALRPERQTLLTVVAGTGHRDAALDGRLAGGDLALAGLEDLAHEHVVDLVGATPARSRAAAMAKPAEVHGAERRKGPGELADRRAGSGDDDRTRHE